MYTLFGPLLLTCINFIPGIIGNYIQFDVLDGITYPLQNSPVICLELTRWHVMLWANGDEGFRRLTAPIAPNELKVNHTEKYMDIAWMNAGPVQRRIYELLGLT